MSVLIKGMEMPTSCDDCPMGGSLCCHLLPGVPALWAEYTNAVKEKRMHSDCPLIPVPPHGRLIDADALRQSIKESIDECHVWAEEVNEGEMYARVSQALGTFVECSLRVKTAPTIIPADPAEEGE